MTLDPKHVAGVGAGVAIGLFAGSWAARRSMGRGLESDGARLVAALSALGAFGAYWLLTDVADSGDSGDDEGVGPQVNHDDVLKTGIAYAEGKGLTIAVTSAHLWNANCDPIGAVAYRASLGNVKQGDITAVTEIAKRELGVSNEWIWSFTNGFEGSIDWTWHGVPEAYKLGQDYRTAYIGGGPLT